MIGLVLLASLALGFLLGWKGRPLLIAGLHARAGLPLPAAVPADPSPTAYPAGQWLCTHAAPWAQEAGFVPGQAYPCALDGMSYCLVPDPPRTWAPFWDAHRSQFCYPSTEMTFRYLGPHPVASQD
jgi:hypothetical protein